MSWQEMIQSGLACAGLPVGRIDGIIGPVTLAALVRFMGCRDEARAAAIGRAMARHMRSHGLLDTPQRLTESLAEWAHESGGYNHLVENMTYSSAAMMRTWPGRFRTHQDTLPFIRQPERLANHVYANRMGNGPPESGDGWHFRGRGLTHTTGRTNYTRAAARLGLPLILRPDLLEEPDNATRAAVLFWEDNGLSRFADLGMSDTITRRINGGTTGIEDRRARKARIRALWR